MTLSARISISLLIAIVTATIVSVIQTGAMFEPVILIGFIAATVASALLGHRSAPAEGEEPAFDQTPSRTDREPGRETGGAQPDRESGTVKWFNVSKGFGFIIRENDEEIFVHFRSIRGKGRRGLRDGQRVSFVVVESDKGPQAEDVVGEN